MMRLNVWKIAFHAERSDIESKELSIVIHTVKHNYICLSYYNEGSNNMFRSYMWAIFRL